MKRLLVASLLTLGLLILPLSTSAGPLPGSDHGGAPFSVVLASSVGTTGSGSVRLTINPGQEEVCWDISVSDLTSQVVASHIHKGGAGTNGLVVVPFFNSPQTGSEFSGCASHNAINITTSERALLDAIIADPAGYYVNVHTTVNPGGEVRGQLAGP